MTPAPQKAGRLAEIRARLEALPELDWKLERDGDVLDVDYGPVVEWPWRIEGVCNFAEEFKEGVPHEPIAEFIAHSREDIEALLRVAEAAQDFVANSGFQFFDERKVLPMEAGDPTRVVRRVKYDYDAFKLADAHKRFVAAWDSLDLADPHPERQ